MCIAILKTKKGIITDEELENSFYNNPDGAGIAYTVKNELIIEKGIFTAKDLIEKVRNAEKICDNNMLIHCRIETSGNMDENNTHPFLINKNVCLIHNGILNIDVPKNSPINDTQIYINRFLKNASKFQLLKNKQIQKLIESHIGKNNKFVFLDNTGYYKIYNEKSGHWKDNVWFSNHTYEVSLFTRYDKWYWDNKENSLIDDAKFENIYKVINSLTEADFTYLGWYPMYDMVNNMLIPETLDNGNAYYLDDIDIDLADLYYEKFYEKEEQIKQLEESIA